MVRQRILPGMCTFCRNVSLRHGLPAPIRHFPRSRSSRQPCPIGERNIAAKSARQGLRPLLNQHRHRAGQRPVILSERKRVEGSRAAAAESLPADAARDPSTAALRASAQDDMVHANFGSTADAAIRCRWVRMIERPGRAADAVAARKLSLPSEFAEMPGIFASILASDQRK